MDTATDSVFPTQNYSCSDSSVRETVGVLTLQRLVKR